jgi:alpha-aminoadipic semialdehyde synthase
MTFPKKKKKVLLLGSGLVAGPAVEVFDDRGDVELVIGKLIRLHFT